MSEPLDALYEKWSASAAQVLAKSKRVDVEQLAGTPAELLAVRTRDDLVIDPLYTRRDETPEPGLPGSFPFVRGADATRDVVQGWRVTERHGDDAQGASEVNEAILDAFNSGASGLWLHVGNGVTSDNLADVFTGVYLDLIPVTLDAGADGVVAAQAFLDVKAASADAPRSVTPTVATIASLGFSPLTAAYSGRIDVDDVEATAFAAKTVSALNGVRAFRLDGTDFATAGATDAQELGYLVAAGLAHVRDLVGAGLTESEALRQITFAVSIDDDQFGVTAKLRAMRKVWSRVAQVIGAPDDGAAVIHAVTDLSMLTQRDPWVNMLRTTVAAFGAGVGGADQVTVLGYDAAIPIAQRTSKASFSRRIARNTQLLLLEESNIGRVLDPAGGSWFVESLTADLAQAAWSVLQNVERAGGYRKALADNIIADAIAAARATRDEDVAHRRTSVTGVNEFPNLGERPLDRAAVTTDLELATPRLARVAQAFEELRDRSDAVLATTGVRPSIELVPLGTVAEHNGRTTFVANLLAAGGIAAINPGPVTAQSVAVQTPIAVICGTKARYAEEGPAVLAALRANGIQKVLLAGPLKEWPESESDKPDGSLRVGIDAVSTLTDLLDQLTGSHGADPAESNVAGASA
ncbi:methylmalonyl-CoA mutase small subunit [Gordonia effusa NBRC 100432]|uniref:methylmalonyl-CoA mutase n=1 Tax=Gordonia effusa NBRC 100432 TaxID=1077974 RepID=H0QWZ8_9ACTN|nr:methylmalonyl-CoA mutase family protein [Gordonia effusa]GAB17349.1 methylmalonyl-CoA mutase small subunit [Gordonia effusa NBRC 100432]